MKAERRFRVRIRVAVPPGGLGNQLNRMRGWLDQVAGRENYAIWGANEPGVPDAVFVYFTDVRIAAAFVDRFACGLMHYTLKEGRQSYSPAPSVHAVEETR